MNEEDIRTKISHLAELKQNHIKRLRALEKRQAILGLNADVSLEIEINDIMETLALYETEISKGKEMLLGRKYRILRTLEDAIVMLETKDVDINDIIQFIYSTEESSNTSIVIGSAAGAILCTPFTRPSIGEVIGSVLGRALGRTLGLFLSASARQELEEDKRNTLMKQKEAERNALMKQVDECIGALRGEITAIESI